MKNRAAIAVLIVAVLSALAGVRADAQENLLHITSPMTGDVVMEGQTLRIVVLADDSVRMVNVMGWTPLPSARTVGNNVFEMEIPKTVSPGKYNLTAMGVTSTLVESLPVTIQIEREDTPVALQVAPLMTFPTGGTALPIWVLAQFADGNKLDVKHSIKTTFQSKDPRVVRVDDQGMAAGVGPGQTTILVGYGGSMYAAIVAYGPKISASKGGEASEGNQVEQTNERASAQNRFAQDAPPQDPGFSITAISGDVTPGKRVRILGSAFTSQQGSGFVTIAKVKAQIVAWSTNEIIVVVPEFTILTRNTTISVHQNAVSEDFPVILPLRTPSRQ
ncbi:MAG: hypothetical protein WAM04_12310 [Candidatus Sulfotelmatobacter sp.]